MLEILNSFFLNNTATTEIYTLSLHDALPISRALPARRLRDRQQEAARLLLRHRPASAARDAGREERGADGDRKSTRLNSSHVEISYAVFCLKKKKNQSKTSYAESNTSLNPLS